MPPKCKVVIDISSDSDGEVANGSSPVTAKPCFEVSPASKFGKTAKSSVGLQKGGFKYSDAETVSEKPTYYTLAWKQAWDKKRPRLDYKSINGNQTAKSESEKAGSVSTSGFLVSKKGIELAEHLVNEQKKRERVDHHDWSGSGVSEIMLNMLKDFDRDLFKENVSPYKKWAYIEGLASFLKVGDLTNWAMCDDSSRIDAIIDEFGLMILTSLDMLSEHNLLAPDRTIKNIPIILLLMLDFLKRWEELDYETRWPCEVVRLCDEACIDLVQAIQHANKMIEVQEDKIQTWRRDYEKKQTSSDFAKFEPFNGNGYMYWASKKSWTPEQDGLYLVKEFYQPEDPRNYGREEEETRKWFRWDWKIEASHAISFKKAYPGGTRRVVYKKAVTGGARRVSKKKVVRDATGRILKFKRR
ncbi:hypothetical protein NHQ30_002094 [Ciborinia camelliae]|nr:hypothetical protein NHQ30_002094 [Ciborinia camelliae]